MLLFQETHQSPESVWHSVFLHQFRLCLREPYFVAHIPRILLIIMSVICAAIWRNYLLPLIFYLITACRLANPFAICYNKARRGYAKDSPCFSGGRL
jgi:hypothetical protein